MITPIVDVSIVLLMFFDESITCFLAFRNLFVFSDLCIKYY